jgi:hypothetical protein
VPTVVDDGVGADRLVSKTQLLVDSVGLDIWVLLQNGAGTVKLLGIALPRWKRKGACNRRRS